MNRILNMIRSCFVTQRSVRVRPGAKRAHHTAGIQCLEDRTLLAAALVKDINVQPNTTGSNLANIVDVGGVTFFTANVEGFGQELWKTDGTAAGTVMVKDISSGSGGSYPRYLTNVNGTLYFRARDLVNGDELWKSDGTTSGTILVKDIRSGSVSSGIRHLTNVNGTLYFQASDGVSGYELWKSDGTTSGTILVKDIRGGAIGSVIGYLTNVNGTLYFRASDGVSGSELWKSDGTSSGTVLVKDIQSGIGDAYPGNLTNVNGILYFRATDGVSGTELWRSDGTTAGTVLVKDIRSSSVSSGIGNLTNVNGTLYFRANDGVSGYELWKSDGNSLGTVLVKDISSGISGSFPDNLTNVNGTLYFRASTSMVNGDELWKTDGTADGTVLVKDIWSGSSGSNIRYLTNLNGTVYFRANNGVNGDELWKSDGTASGTILVKDIRSGGSSGPRYLTNVNGTLYFRANDGVNGYELWKSDGTSVGTVLIKDLLNANSNASLFSPVNVNGTFFFRANDGVSGYELWKSDGTAAGTVLVKDIGSGINGSNTRYLTNVNGTLYFVASDGVNGDELWKSDGTAAGTVLVKDILIGGSANPSQLTNVNGTLYFRAFDDLGGTELWRSDGTTAGTILVKDILSGFFSSSPSYLTNVNGTLYFRASDGTNGDELWKSDGTATGTMLVKDIRSGNAGSKLSSLRNINGTLYFRADDGVSGYELWRSDGTPGGTALVKDIWPGSVGSNLTSFTTVNDTLYIRATDGVNGYELWKSDGTTSGTILVRDILSGGMGSNPGSLTNVNGTLYFSANDGVAGNELWKTDGTNAGTVRVKDINTGIDSSVPSGMTFVNNVLYFKANDGVHGDELWRSDGTEAGTRLETDIFPGLGGSNISTPISVGTQFFFSAASPGLGRELWTVLNPLFDTSFSNDGIAVTSVGPSVDQGGVAVVQSDGKTVVAGRSLNGSRYDLAIVRYNLDGTLDTTFGSSGTAMFSIDSGNLNPTDIVLDSSGRIVVVCEHQISGVGDFAVFRLNTNGSLDTSFNSTGYSIVDFGSLEDNPQSLVIQPDGRIVVAGESRNPANGLADVAIARLLSNGLLDTSFSGDGKHVQSLGTSHDIAKSVLLQSNGAIVIGGSVLGAGSHWNFVAARFTAAGALDTTFGSGGSFVQAIGSQSAQANSINQLSDGRLILTGHAWNSTNVDAAYVRLTANGVLDNQPGNDAIRQIPFSASDDYFYSTTVVNDKIVMAGSSSGAGGQVMAVMRLTANGELDSNFDSDGRLTVHPGYDGGIAIDVATSPDGKLLVAGRSTEGSRQRFSTARLFNPEAPTNIQLSSSTILENMPSGTLVGTLSATDPNGYDSHNFELVSGSGDTGNASFAIINGNQLITTTTFDFESSMSHSIRLRVIDAEGLSYEKSVQISVLNENDAPPTVSAASFLASGVVNAGATSVTVTFNEAVNGSTNVGHYELRRAGTDGLLGNADDPVITILSATMSGNIATLNFAALPEDVYRLTVKDTISDLVANSLDGDGNGLVGGNWRKDFVAGALTTSLTSPNGFVFDTEFGGFGAGQLVQGTNAAFDGFGRLLVGGNIYSPVAGQSSTATVRSNSTTGLIPVTGGPYTNSSYVPSNTPGTPLSATVTTNSPTPTRLSASLQIGNRGTTAETVQAFWIVDGVNVGFETFVVPPASGGYAPVYSWSSGMYEFEHWLTLSPGLHTVQIALSPNSGTGATNLTYGDYIPSGNTQSITVAQFPTLQGFDPTAIVTTVRSNSTTGLIPVTGGPYTNSSYVPSNTPGTPLSATVTTNSPTPTRLSASLQIGNRGTTAETVQAFWIVDGVNVGFETFVVPPASGGYAPVYSWSSGMYEFEHWLTLSPGLHTVQIALSPNSGTGATNLTYGDYIPSGNTQSITVAQFPTLQGFDPTAIVTTVRSNSTTGLIPVTGGPYTNSSYVPSNTPGTPLSATVTTNSPTPTRLSASLQIGNRGTTAETVQAFWIVDGVNVGFETFVVPPASGGYAPVYSWSSGMYEFEHWLTLSPGLHTVQIALSPNSGTGATNLTYGDYIPSGNTQSITVAQFPTMTQNLGRTAMFGLDNLHGLKVARAVTSPATGLHDFARTVDEFSNSTVSPITTHVRFVGNLGSDLATTVFATSDGDLLVEPTDLWFGTDDADGSGTPAIIHLLHGPSGLQPTSVNVIDDNVEWTYDLTVPAGETKRLAHFTVLGTTRAEAIAAANVLVTANGFGGEAAAFLTTEELQSLANFKFNSAPTNISLSNSSVAENAGLNASIGALSFTDPNPGDSATFSLPAGLGDNSLFNIAPDGITLRANGSFDFESQVLYSVTVRVTDTGGLSFDKQFVINVTDNNEAPTNIALQNVVATLPENTSTSARIRVADIVVTDDATGTNSLSLTGADAGTFEIDGVQLFLRAGVVLNYETKASFSVNVVVADTTLGTAAELSVGYSLMLTNVTELGGIDVQLGQTQRSYVRYLDAVFDRSDDLMSMIGSGRFQLTKRDLNGNTPINIPLTPSMFSIVGNSARIDFGSNGLGGNRNTSAGDGYYELGIDMDGNGSYESKKNFYRLLGDVNGDRKVDSVDSSLVTSSFGLTNPNRDVNGDGFVNSNDRTLVLRSIGRKLKDDLFADD